MLSYLAQYEEIFGPFRLLRFITLRTLLASGTSLLIGYMLGPWVIAKLRQFSFQQSFRDRKEVGKLADLHEGKKNTPTMGGLLICLSVTLSSLLWAQWNVWVLTALLVYVSLTGLGFMDDFLKVSKRNSKGVSSRFKLLWQSVTTAVAMAILLTHPESSQICRQLWLPFFKEAVLSEMPIWFMFVFLFFVLVGSSNAINLTDGVDGLAIGCTISAALVYAIMAYAAGNAIIAEYLLISNVPGSGELTIICGCLVGAGLAFLWFNAHPADVFMGDTGSLALGGLIGIVAFMVHQPVTLVIVGGIFVMEAVSVILQVASFKMTGKRIFRMAPIHHHFELKGWAESRVVVRFWILSLIFAIAGLGTLKLR
ncbi:phospho-N-acetylmuramoyl-pentapeptide-transferase [Pelagicoccus sp. SDUM812003]|uniref:phospho-N-acetylmuramoyl-pentapeptide- transferase n=1 Tax=Pelagicoccus sp. SDUM812003 TaxID=3041267 RepID=UPI00280F5A53|nr:phospho-N-acetylmuramoyl-pentapeptide-transferase [Pelagicoccus sp. SDUM812003]MDQ8204409.1 phospho-N-acetylmuramoyl-pentapeptide-transferase [Pelagicoccus sp. SDUM812003]